MESIQLKAWERIEFGKGKIGRLRKSGFTPAVLYGPGLKENICIKLNTIELEKVLHNHRGTNVLINLSIEGGAGDKQRTVILKDVSRDPVNDTLEHVDMMNILKDRKITVEVPIILTGTAQGVAKGGILHQEARNLRVECLPHDIPDTIEIDVSLLDIGHSVHVNDIKLRQGLKLLDDGKLTVALVSAPMAEEKVKTPEEVQAELAKSFAEKEAPAEETSEEKSEGKPAEKPAGKSAGKKE